ncbi:MAG: hypothetical protein JW828_03955 [Sedimentisphaerales bacterium]|nr:hypothetical protein [Sedimentisphaerales bacterium]
MLRIVAVFVVLSGVAIGFVYLDRYAKSIEDLTRFGPLEYYRLPEWVKASPAVGEQIEKLLGKTVALEPGTAENVAVRLSALPWLYNVYTQTAQESVRVRADWRKPMAVVRQGNDQVHLAWIEKEDPLYDPDQRRVAVIGFVPVEGITLVEITGAAASIPRMQNGLGTWSAPEIVTTAEMLRTFGNMDSKNFSQNPLLGQIQRIDVSNFGGRKDSKAAHVVLYATDGTEIRWGAAFGQAATYAEATEVEKVASLYGFYRKHGTLLGKVKYIDLRIAQIIPPRPMD